MTEQEYKSLLANADEQYRKAKNKIDIDFALSHNTVKVGDIVCDSSNCIKVERIRVYKSFGLPECLYEGVKLKLDKTPTKKSEQASVFQSRMINNES